ncbi:GntR family transcriptional regulator [Albidovulum sp.]
MSGAGAAAGPESARDRFERIYLTLRDRICLLDHPPGTRLSEETLAAEFGISRTPLRRVLARLEEEGLVRSVHGVGTFVTDVELEELEQTYRLRMELAELAGRLDPVTPDAAFHAALRGIEARGAQLAIQPDARAFAGLNLDFFLLRLALTANAPLRAISERLYLRTARIWITSVQAARVDLAEEVAIFRREIAEVLHAIAVGDVAAAALIQRAHISMSFARLRRGSGRGG